MGWTRVPDMDSGTETSDDNPFAGPKLQTPGKVSVNLPTDEWLSNKLSKLNLTLVQGYPSRTTEAGSLQRDQFVRPAKPKANGTVCTQKARRTLAPQLKLGTLALPALIAPI